MTEIKVRRRPAFFKRQLLVDKKVQLSILAYAMAVSIAALLFVAAFVAVLVSMPESSSTSYLLVLFMMLLVSMVAFTFLGIYITNKTAGPIYRLRKSMQLIAEGGTVEKVSFRKGDHFFDLAAEYNRVLDRLLKAETKFN